MSLSLARKLALAFSQILFSFPESRGVRSGPSAMFALGEARKGLWVMTPQKPDAHNFLHRSDRLTYSASGSSLI
jgi:hypothetical protein